jgi:hypothetical protein
MRLRDRTVYLFEWAAIYLIVVNAIAGIERHIQFDGISTPPAKMSPVMDSKGVIVSNLSLDRYVGATRNQVLTLTRSNGLRGFISLIQEVGIKVHRGVIREQHPKCDLAVDCGVVVESWSIRALEDFDQGVEISADTWGFPNIRKFQWENKVGEFVEWFVHGFIWELYRYPCTLITLRSISTKLIGVNHSPQFAVVNRCDNDSDKDSRALNNVRWFVPPFGKIAHIVAAFIYFGSSFFCAGMFLFFSGIHTGRSRPLLCILSLVFAFVFSLHGVETLLMVTIKRG